MASLCQRAHYVSVYVTVAAAESDVTKARQTLAGARLMLKGVQTKLQVRGLSRSKGVTSKCVYSMWHNVNLLMAVSSLLTSRACLLTQKEHVDPVSEQLLADLVEADVSVTSQLKMVETELSKLATPS